MIWLGVLGCAALAFLFAGMEAGILSVDPVRLRHRARRGEAAAQTLERLLEHPGRLLLTVLLVTDATTIAAVVLSTRALVNTIGLAGYAFALALWLPAVLFFLRLVPKALFRRFPARALAAFARVLEAAGIALAPAVWLGSAAWALVYPKGKRRRRKLFAARGAVEHFLEEGQRSGALSADERALIDRVVAFRSLCARDLMTPIDRADIVRSDASVADLREAGRRSGADWFAVRQSDGAITGVISLFELLLEPKAVGQVESHQRRAVVVPADEPAFSLFRKLRVSRTALAIVTGPDGAACGTVSSQAVLRRLVSAAAPPAAT